MGKKCDIYTQRNILNILKIVKFNHVQQNGPKWRTSYWVEYIWLILQVFPYLWEFKKKERKRKKKEKEEKILCHLSAAKACQDYLFRKTGIKIENFIWKRRYTFIDFEIKRVKILISLSALHGTPLLRPTVRLELISCLNIPHPQHDLSAIVYKNPVLWFTICGMNNHWPGKK